MPRAPRALTCEGPYHVTSRGNRGQALFVEDRDRNHFLTLLEGVASARRWTLLAWCLMTNHYHLVLETPNLDLSAGMQRLNGDYAQWFNRRHDFEGHLFRHRFHAGFIERESHALEVLRYVALNPVRAGLCATPSEWSWSSYARAMSHPASLATAALSFFGEDPHHARERLRAFVEAPDPH